MQCPHCAAEINKLTILKGAMGKLSGKAYEEVEKEYNRTYVDRFDHYSGTLTVAKRYLSESIRYLDRAIDEAGELTLPASMVMINDWIAKLSPIFTALQTEAQAAKDEATDMLAKWEKDNA